MARRRQWSIALLRSQILAAQESSLGRLCWRLLRPARVLRRRRWRTEKSSEQTRYQRLEGHPPVSCQHTVTPPHEDNIHTLLGVHRVTLSSPYRSAICANRALSRILLCASSDNPCSPINAGCWNGIRPNSSISACGSCGELISAWDVCSSTIRRPWRLLVLPIGNLACMSPRTQIG